MSLINDMLKNLEKRKAPVEGIKFSNSKMRGTEEESARFLPFLLGGFLLLILCLAGIGIFYIFHHKYTSWNFRKFSHVRQKNNIINHSPIIMINNLHVSDLPDSTTIQFDFNGVPNFTTAFNPSDNTETVFINNSKINKIALCQQLGKLGDCLVNNQIPLPAPTSSISSINIAEKENHQLLLIFKLISPATLQKSTSSDKSLILFFSKTQNNPENNISILSPPNSSIENGPTDPLILQPVGPISLTPTKKLEQQYNGINNLISLNQLDQAQAKIDALTPNQQRSLPGVMVRAKLALADGHSSKALAILQSYPLSGSTQDRDFSALYAATLTFNGRYSQAVLLYKSLLNEEPDNANWLLGLAIAAMSNQEYILARDSFQRLLQNQDLNPEVVSYAHKQLEKININYDN